MLPLFAFLLLACGDETTPERVEKPQQDEVVEEKAEAKQEIFKLGETVKMGDLSFTLNSARWDSGDEFMKPDEGEKWLTLDATIENLGEKSEVISSLMMFSLFDEGNYSRDLEIFADTKGSLDGELGAGRKMSGEIAFNVEADQNEWEFIFEPNFLGFGQAIFLVNADEVQ